MKQAVTEYSLGTLCGAELDEAPASDGSLCFLLTISALVEGCTERPTGDPEHSRPVVLEVVDWVSLNDKLGSVLGSVWTGWMVVASLVGVLTTEVEPLSLPADVPVIHK